MFRCRRRWRGSPGCSSACLSPLSCSSSCWCSASSPARGKHYVMSSHKVGSKFFTKIVPTLVYLRLAKLSAASGFSHEGPQEQGNPSRSTWQACFSFLSRQGGRPIKDSSLCFYVLCHPYSFINHLALNASKGTLTGERLTRSNAGTSALLSTLSQNILRATKCKTYIKRWCLSLEDHLTHAGLCKKTTNPP